MNVRRLVAVLFVLALSATVFYRSEAAAPAAGDAEGSVALRYAKAQLKFAELTVQKAESMNRRVPGTLTGSVIMQFADEVELSKMRLQAVSRGEDDSMQLNIQRAEFGVRSAEGRLKKAIEANQRVPGAVPDLDIERYTLGVEIAKLRYEQGKSLVGATSEAKMQWQVDMLNDDLARVREQTYLLGQNRLSQF